MNDRIASAILADELPEDAFDDIALMVHSGRAPRLDAAVVTKLIQHTHTWIDRHPPRAYSLARFALLAAPRIPARTAAERARRQFLIAEAYREYAAACVERRFINEARQAVLDAKAHYAAPEVAPFVTHERLLVAISEAKVLFHQDHVPFAVRAMERIAAQFLDEFDDARRYTVVRQYLAAILMETGRAKEALPVLFDVVELTKERGIPAYFAALAHNIAAALKLAGEACPQHLVEQARELLEQHLEGHAPRANYLLVEQLKQESRISEAISELYKTRAEFQARGDAIIAAAMAREIVEQLIPAGRLSEARYIGEAAIPELESAGMLLEVRRIRELLGGPEKRKRKTG